MLYKQKHLRILYAERAVEQVQSAGDQAQGMKDYLYVEDHSKKFQKFIEKWAYIRNFI